MVILEAMGASRSLVGILDEIETSMLHGDGIMGQMTSVSVSVAALCACVAFIKITYDYYRNSGYHVYELLRPFILFAIVSTFSWSVYRPLNSVVNAFTARLSTAVDERKGSFWDTWQKSVRADNITPTTFKVKSDGTIIQNVSGTVASAADWLNSRIMKVNRTINENITGWVKKNLGLDPTFLLDPSWVLPGACHYLFQLAGLVMLCLARINIILLGVFGPLCFALSILPWFPNGAKLWIEKFIQYNLWCPVIHVVNYVALSFLEQMNSSGNLSHTMACLVCYIVSIIAIFEVPKLTSMIIEGTVGEYAGSGIAGAAGSQVSGLAGGAGGRAAGAVGKAIFKK